MNGKLVTKILRTAAIGAVVGGAVGAATLILPKKGLSLSREQDPDLHMRIINLKYAPEAEEALQRMLDYKPLDPEAYQLIQLNLDRLVGIHLLVCGKDPVQLSYEIKAQRYRSNIEQAVVRLSQRYQQQPSKQFTDDVDVLLKCADNFMYNIRQCIQDKFATGKIKVTK